MRNLFQQVLTKSSAGLLIVALASVLAVGCGNSDNFVFTNTAPVATTGNLTFNFVQAQGVITVPIGTTTLEFTFYDGPNQTGNVTLTDSQPYAAQVTVFGVPTNTQSYRIVARNANGAALATTTGAVTVVPGQTTTVDVTGALTVLTQPTNTALNVFVSNNGAGNAGDLDLFDQLFGFVRTFVSGNNQGIALDGIGTGFHNGDTDLNIISRLAERTGSFDNTMDRTITLAGSTTVKGSTVFPQAGVAVLADFGGNALYSVSTQGAQIATTFAATAPWDAVADETNDRLFVALTDGSIGVEDDVTTDFSAPFDRTFTATGLDNAHGIAYDAASDTLIVSDVGDPGVADDGEIYIFGNASTASGTVSPIAVIGGSNTLLGNPVDIDLANGDLRVAEKSQDKLLIFANILQTTGGNIAPAISVSEDKPESLTSQAPVTLGPDNSDIDGGVTVQNILVSTNQGGGNNGTFIRMSPTLTGPTTIDLGIMDTTESVKVDLRGDAYLTDSGGLRGLLRFGRTLRDSVPVGTQIDRIGGTVSNPKGLDLVESRGLVMIADAGDDTVKIFGKESDFSNPVAVMDLPGAPAQSTWDLDYDPISDRLFVTQDEVVYVYDNYLAGNPATATPDRTIDVTPAVFLHGLVYDAANDVLFLSDVGAVTAGANTDGLLFVINNASTADGATTPDITIDNDTLGNPVDIAYDGANLYVAEKTQGVVERYDNIRASAGGSVAATLSAAAPFAESVSLITGL